MAITKKAKPRSTHTATNDAISLLKEDHKRVKGLLRKLEAASSRRTKSRDSLLEQVEREVKVHSTLEQEVFYPAFRDAVRRKEEKQLLFEAVEEHHVVDVVISEFHDGKVAPDSFAAKCKVLKDLIEHHIREEEREMFPAAKKAFDEGELQELGERIDERKREIASESGVPSR